MAGGNILFPVSVSDMCNLLIYYKTHSLPFTIP